MVSQRVMPAHQAMAEDAARSKFILKFDSQQTFLRQVLQEKGT